MGAWIETDNATTVPDGYTESPLAWGRGLKRVAANQPQLTLLSPLAWGRGLKLARARMSLYVQRVAPRVGAWIET